jgi:hypothetical protein
MTSRERMDRAMRPREGRLPDRVPVMCQLALGHYFLHAGDAVEIWHDSGAFADALVAMQRRYRFDGILVNLPGRSPAWRARLVAVREDPRGRLVRWADGRGTIVPPDDNPRAETPPASPRLADLEPEHLYYIEPHDIGGLTFPTRWGIDADRAEPGAAFFPPWHWDTIRAVRRRVPDVSVHGEVFSPFSQWMELMGCAEGLMALIRDPVKVEACLDRLADGAAALARGHFAAGADAVLISSAYAGAAFISPPHYRRFVLPFERKVIALVRAAIPGAVLYTHTCGAIGDRLELLEESGTCGIDTLDPPPLGTVDLADARRRLGLRVFVKGNVDPVNTVLRGSPAACFEDARARLAVAKPGGGYVLSTACSVPPHAPPINVLALTEAVELDGEYEQGRLRLRPGQGSPAPTDED